MRKVNSLRGFRSVARSFMKEICILAPGSSIPACHANWACRSRNRTFGLRFNPAWDSVFGQSEEASVSSRAIAIAREAGPNPTHIRSWSSSGGVRLSPERLAEECIPFRFQCSSESFIAPLGVEIMPSILFCEGMWLYLAITEGGDWYQI